MDDELKHFFNNPEHHCYLFISSNPDLFKKAEIFSLKLANEGKVERVDIWRNYSQNFGIEDARQLKEIHSNKSMGNRRLFIVGFESVTGEAQNSLLKLLEEPSTDTTFYIFIPNKDILFETILSRCWVVDRAGKKESFDQEWIKKFLKSSISDRFSLTAPIIASKDKNKAIQFLNNLESVLYRSLEKRSSLAGLFEEILESKKFLQSRSPSVKMIIEHICCIAPTQQEL